jgi:hypothetical protein
MCLDCGCDAPNDTHGDPRHITLQQVEQAAQASGVSTSEVAQRIQQEVRKSSGQSQTTGGN